MARFKDAEILTSELTDLARELHAELADGEGELENMIDLADRISERADGIASAFTTVNQTLLERLQATTGAAKGKLEPRAARPEPEGQEEGSAGGSDILVTPDQRL